MRAENKPIKDWLYDISRGVVRLPRFQRDETWTHRHVESFLDTVIRQDSPIGVLLLLDVDSQDQPFKTRPLEGTVNNGELCRQHLLDGQQRLTALWRSMNDNYEDRGYFIPFDRDSHGEYKLRSKETDGQHQVTGIARRGSSWIGNSTEEYQRNFIPVSLLHPGDDGRTRAINWTNVVGESEDDRNKLLTLIMELREEVGSRVLPYLLLPMSTSPDNAINVFISTNTSFVKLTPFNIAVAQFEAQTSDSLQNSVDKLIQEVPGIIDLEGEDGVGDLALKVTCLFQNRKPTYGNYKNLDMGKTKDMWDKLTKGVKWAVDILGEEKIWSKRTLPSAVPLRVLPAIHQFMPTKGDDVAKAKRLVVRYLWLSFTSGWYERQANDRLYNDYKALVRALKEKTYVCTKERTVFGCNAPNSDELIQEGWPTGRGILRRAILAISTKHGARDVASNERITSAEKLQKRHYHHIFPKALLAKHANGANPNLALNCMLIEGPTNHDWSASWPGDYLLERAKESKLRGKKAEQEINKRLESHLMPSAITMGAIESASKPLQKTYDQFIQARARLIAEKIKQICENGEL